MKTLELTSDQIITLNDYPLYSNSVLTKYLYMCMTDEDLPYVPVIRKNIVSIHFKVDLLKIFQDFEKQNPTASYFILDGSHRTTALALQCRSIKVIVYETDQDILDARTWVTKGLILENATLDLSLEENCEILNTYFTEKPNFMTVQQKTDKLLRENFITPLK